MWNVLSNLIIGVVAGLLTLYLTSKFHAGRGFLQRMFGIPYKIAGSLAEGGITRMTLSRADYHRYREGAGPLRNYLALAQQTIDIISISLNVTQTEGALVSLFREKITGNPTFRVRVTLLDPMCPSLPYLAKSLDLAPKELRGEIEDILDKLVKCKNDLPASAQKRLEIYLHDTIPIGSAILLDAIPTTGRIQIETKLYKAPRTESFGFEVIGPSPFYERNFKAWMQVFDDSVVWTGPVRTLSLI